MNAEDLVEVRRCATHAEAVRKALVLAAVGIDCHVLPAAEGTGLFVGPADAAHARSELSAYEQENPPAHRPALPALGDAHRVDAVIAYCGVLVFFFVADYRSMLSVDWSAAGAAQAGPILGGEWWRTVTSLTLHADLGHLAGNLVFGVVVGLLLARLLGSGVAWLAVVASGVVGNALDAAVQPPEHMAVGASTALFGALGILSGYRQGSPAGPLRGGLRRWAPVAAGIMLLAFLGFGGEDTDVLAHVLGFAAGGVIGLGLARLPRQRMEGVSAQRLCGGLACGLPLLAWLLALSPQAG